MGSDNPNWHFHINSQLFIYLENLEADFPENLPKAVQRVKEDQIIKQRKVINT